MDGKNQKTEQPSDLHQVEEEEQQRQSQKQRVQRNVNSLVHACDCRDQQCTEDLCAKMKRLLHHTTICTRKSDGNCPICKTVYGMFCYHANQCIEVKCAVPYCLNIKHKLNQSKLARSTSSCQPADSTTKKMTVDTSRNIQVCHYGRSNAQGNSGVNIGARTQEIASTEPNSDNEGLQKAKQQLVTTLQNSNLTGSDKFQQILNILKSNPHLMTAFRRQRQKYLESASSQFSMNSPMEAPSSVSSTNTQTWRQFIPTEYREYMVRIYSQTMHAYGIAKCGKMIEDEIYAKAESKQQYCELMFDKIYTDQMEMEEKNKIRKFEPAQPTQQVRVVQKPSTSAVRKCVVLKRKFKQITRKYQPNMRLIRITPRRIVANRKNCQRLDRPAHSPMNQALDE
ncbi:uncharacterized protein LOC129569818 [Sitodiplosis mosellana]|uniref:uncharacterized protein LOC129569818 n=1 Tax=Sitodiplosis mosellana TaxID=263140 RepID=UPI002443EB20|nr:uncharacterized protein LOC129569818 [Sitodiplosis mosellana]